MHDLTRRAFGSGLGMLSVLAAFGGLARAAVRDDLYACEGCEAISEGEPVLGVLKLPVADEPGEAMVIGGVVRSASTGAGVGDVVLYAHHTNAAGLYANGSSETMWSRRHGKLRGWVKTAADGSYRIETIKPAPYPDMTMPAHVHVFLSEPGRRPYYIDDVVFAGEFKVDDTYRARQELRGGSGIVTLARSPEGVWLARRDIVLERHPA